MKISKKIILSLILVVISFSIICNEKLYLYAININNNVHNKHDFRIMTYNVCNGGYNRCIEKSNRKDSLYSVIKMIDPDIICLQEYNKWNIRKLDSLTLQVYPFSACDGQILSKYKIENADSLWFSTYNNRPCCFADIILKKRIIRIYNIRLASNKFNITDKNMFLLYQKAKQVRKCEIAKLIIHMCSCPYPIIVCGDFNCFSWSNEILSIQDHYLTDTWWSIGNGFGITYSSWLLNLRLDHIFYDGSFVPTGVYVFESNFSDHLPLIADFCTNW